MIYIIKIKLASNQRKNENLIKKVVQTFCLTHCWSKHFFMQNETTKKVPKNNIRSIVLNEARNIKRAP